MHDPTSLICRIDIPLPWKRRSYNGMKWATFTLAEIWHVDPETDGTDDSCGRFIRARHGSPEILQRITRRFESDWDNVFTTKEEDHDEDDGPFKSDTFFRGYFTPNGDPVMSTHGIALNLFFIAAIEVLGTRKKAMRFLNRHLVEILIFAENPVDSMHDSITGTFRHGKPRTTHERKDWITSTAAMVFAWVLRESRPWWRSPSFHVHHWSIKVPAYRTIRRWLLNRCCKCGGRFYFGECPITDNWNNPEPRWFRGETGLYCHKCSGMNSGQIKA